MLRRHSHSILDLWVFARGAEKIFPETKLPSNQERPLLALENGNSAANGAGEGNRTLLASLEGWSFTTKLHPHRSQQGACFLCPRRSQVIYFRRIACVVNLQTVTV